MASPCDPYEDLLSFWFGGNVPAKGTLSPANNSSLINEQPFWFSSTPSWDAEIAQRFKTLHESAAQGNLDHWMNDPKPCLALIILLDQVPRNIFRKTKKAYATDGKALKVAKHFQSMGFFTLLESPYEKKFAAIPFSHSENISDQETAVALFSDIQGGQDGWTSYAEWYLSIIRTFGRFPQRNEILERQSTPEEIKFLHKYN